MFALGGATKGHLWSDHELLENRLRLDVNLLHRAGALKPGAETIWAWDSRKTCLRATHGEIFLTGARKQTIRVDWLSVLKSRYVRPRFLCPGCQRGRYHLYDKAGTFICHACARYDYRSRHRQRFNPAYARIVRLRKKLGADPDPLAPLPPRPRSRMGRVDYDRVVAELARAQGQAYGDVARLLADLDQRANQSQSHD